MSLARAAQEIGEISVGDTALFITWGDGQRSRFHHIWLRDNCSCRLCGPHASGSRLQKLLDIPDHVAPSSAFLDQGRLRIVWAGDNHQSHYDPAWLREHAYSPPTIHKARRPRKTLWDGSLTEWPAVDWDRMLVDLAERHKLHASVSEVGFVLVRGLGTAHDAIEKLAAEIGYIRETHYSRTFDLVTRREPTILADLAGPLLPHTDETYRRVPTGINIFHCIRPCPDGGGASQLVDAHLIASLFRERDPDGFRLLTTVPVRHERRISGQVIIAEVPAIVLDHDGEVSEVRLNERTMTALCVDEELVASTYAALRTVFRLAYAAAYRIQYNLKAGEALIFDNLRVLHARTGYTGDRFLRQCQVMRDEFFAKGIALSEQIAFRDSAASSTEPA